jgi:hypothetical protein
MVDRVFNPESEWPAVSQAPVKQLPPSEQLRYLNEWYANPWTLYLFTTLLPSLKQDLLNAVVNSDLSSIGRVLQREQNLGEYNAVDRIKSAMETERAEVAARLRNTSR